LYNTEVVSDNVQNTINNQIYHWPTHSSGRNTFGRSGAEPEVAQSNLPGDSIGPHFAANLPFSELMLAPSSPTGRSSRGTTMPSHAVGQELSGMDVSAPKNRLLNPHYSRDAGAGSNLVQDARSGKNNQRDADGLNADLHFYDSGYLTTRPETVNQAGEELLDWHMLFEGHQAPQYDK
jgi:hypothetical protein